MISFKGLPISAGGYTEPVELGWFVKNNISVEDIGCGREYSVVLDKTGKVWGFGNDKYGHFSQVVHRVTSNSSVTEPVLCGERIEAISCGETHVVCVAEKKNHLIGWGVFDDGQCVVRSFGGVDVPREERGRAKKELILNGKSLEPIRMDRRCKMRVACGVDCVVLY